MIFFETMMVSLLPIEILQKIFSQLNANVLYNCLLVNRYWCSTVVPLLWQKPFDFFDYQKVQLWNKGANLTQVYVSCLSHESKNSLIQARVILSPRVFIKPTFDYASFLQCLDYILLFQATGVWIDENEKVSHRTMTYRHYLVVEELCKLFFHHSSNLKYLKYDKSHSLPIASDIGYIQLRYLPGAEICLSKLEGFCMMDFIPNEIIFTIAQVAHNLKEIKIEISCDNDDALATLFGSQKNLRSLIIYAEDYLPTIAEALKNRISTLRKIELNWEFSLPLDLFAESTELEQFSAYQYSSIATRKIFEVFSNTKFKKLQKLHLTTPKLFLDQISTLISNTEGSLIDLNIDYERSKGIKYCRELIMAIGKTCPNIRKLRIFVPDEAVPLLPSLLVSCPKLQNLEFLTGDSREDLDIITFDVSEYLPKMGKVLPSKLSNFFMSYNWVLTAKAFREFLEYSENRLEPGRKIDFNFGKELTIEHVEIVEEYGVKGVLNTHPSTTLGKHLKFFRNQIEWRNIINNNSSSQNNNQA